ncbi:MarR family winged helix-turn-helix transcriptional regulator [Cohnella sp. REN36]|uniref:MarR family winged helix-turn-helix transcriptional regulator n=1 Tax=Cohnella sp. REN36 TaxID=2887347 RepID=UPI001D14A5F5|nr:MarR family transcriptional regulator [Cohnella sp. REN36]MCC3375096.1 MarR family transcriptional regulator [Cohnella sp. REN36]
MIDCKLLSQIISRYKSAMFTMQRRLNALIRDEMPQDLTVDQFATLEYIRSRGQCTSSELAEVFCVGKSSITAIISRLFDKSLIRRLPDDKDRRVTYLRLTEEGERMAVDIDGRLETLLSRYMGHFDEKEATQFIETYEKLAHVLVQPIEQDAPAGEEKRQE